MIKAKKLTHKMVNNFIKLEKVNCANSKAREEYHEKLTESFRKNTQIIGNETIFNIDEILNSF